MPAASGAPRRHTMPSAQANVKRGVGAGRTSVSQSLRLTGHFVRLHLRPWRRDRGQNRRILSETGAPGRIRTCDPRLRRPCVGSVINRRLSPTSPRWSGSREFTPILAALRRFIASHAITDRRDDHVNVADRTRSRRGGQGWVDSTPRVRERSHEAGARLTSAQADRLRKEADRLGIAPAVLARATLEDLCDLPDAGFRAAAERIVPKHQELSLASPDAVSDACRDPRAAPRDAGAVRWHAGHSRSGCPARFYCDRILARWEAYAQDDAARLETEGAAAADGQAVAP